MKLRKLTTADEFLKLNNLINDKDVNKAIEKKLFEAFREDRRIYEKGKEHSREEEMEIEAQVDLQIMTDRNNKRMNGWSVWFCDEYDGEKNMVQNNLTKDEATKTAKALCKKHNNEQYYILNK